MATHDLTFVFEDGRSLHLKGSDTETVYMTALKNKVRILTDCLEGACATCKASCTQGEYSLREYSEEALSDEERDARRVLTCQMVPKSACIIEFPYESSVILKTAPEKRPARVTAVETVAKDVARLVITPDDPSKPIPFLPGQYVHISIPGTDAKRSYSFANPPGAGPDLVFYIKVLPQGAMSEYVSGRAKPGDQVTIEGAFGKFYLRPPARPIVMVAGGTGLAPMLSMLDHIVASGAAAQPITLLYGANFAAELFAKEQLESYAAKGLRLTTERVVVSGDGWQGPTGHVTSRLRDEIINGGEVDVYLCGPPPMIDAGRAWLKAHGVAEERIHTEKFLPS